VQDLAFTSYLFDVATASRIATFVLLKQHWPHIIRDSYNSYCSDSLGEFGWWLNLRLATKHFVRLDHLQRYTSHHFR
jgi:hypothetical protein